MFFVVLLNELGIFVSIGLIVFYRMKEFLE